MAVLTSVSNFCLFVFLQQRRVSERLAQVNLVVVVVVPNLCDLKSVLLIIFLLYFTENQICPCRDKEKSGG